MSSSTSVVVGPGTVVDVLVMDVDVDAGFGDEPEDEPQAESPIMAATIVAARSRAMRIGAP